jgi:hypothetical protein
MILKKWVFCYVVLLVIGVNSAAAQDDSVWRLTNSQDLRVVAGRSYTYGSATLSNDGTRIAWFELNLGLCVFLFSTGGTSCYSMPWHNVFYDNAPQLSEMGLVWSADDNAIAFHEPIRSGADPDIWVFNLESLDLINLTNDGNTRNIGESVNPGERPVFDYFPVWSATGEEIYFFRIFIDSNNSRQLGLYRIALGDRRPDLVHQFSTSTNVHGVALSPDGAYMALSLTPELQMSSGDGVWIVRLSDGDLEPLATEDVFRIGMPTWIDAVVPFSLEWRSTGLIVSALGAELTANGTIKTDTTVQNYFHVDPTDGSTRALVDLSTLGVEQVQSGDAYAMPRAGVISQDGETFFYIHFRDNSREASLSALPLATYVPELLSEAVDLVISGGSPLFVMLDEGLVLVNQLTLLTFARD